MSNAGDFIIDNGVLKKYVGPGGDVVIPEGVSQIGTKAFFRCVSVTTVVIPEGVTEIDSEADTVLPVLPPVVNIMKFLFQKVFVVNEPEVPAM